MPADVPAALALARGHPERPLGPVLVLGGATAGRPAPDQRPGAGPGRGGDQVLVLPLDHRVGDLEHVEDAHGDVVGQVRQNARHADEPGLPLVAHRHDGLDGLLGLHLGAAGRHVHLHQVQVVGAEPAQALLDPGTDVGGAVVVRERRPGPGWRGAEQAAALGSQEVLVAPVAQVTPDQFLAAAVVDGRVDQVDAAVQHLVEQPSRGVVHDRRAVRLAAQFHGPVAEDGHVRSGPPQAAGLQSSCSERYPAPGGQPRAAVPVRSRRPRGA